MLLDLRLVIRRPMPDLLSQIKRGKLAIFETIEGDGIEEVVLTGPPRVDKDTGDLLIGFRRPDKSLDLLVICENIETERNVSQAELNGLMEGLAQAINECGTMRAKLDVANRYVNFCVRNRFPTKIRKIIESCFPPEIRGVLKEGQA